MLLERLVEYANRLTLPPPMYQLTPVRYVIQLDERGTLRNLVSRSSGAKNDRGVPMLVPSCIRTSATKPILLADHAEYTLGLGNERAGSDRADARHLAYVELVTRCARETAEPLAQAVASFLAPESGQIPSLLGSLPSDFDPGALITFQVAGVFPTELVPVQRFWAREAAATDATASPMQCLVCGQMRPCAEVLAVPIKGIPGDTMGITLISANNEAFLSYGLKSALIAPTCEECGFRFSHALNALIAHETTHVRSGDSLYIFWAREELGFSLATLLTQARPEDVRVFLHSVWGANPSAARTDITPFYAATLSAAKARIVWRDWIETTLDEARRHLARYFELQRLRGPDGNDQWFALYALTAATVNTKATREEAAPQVGQALLHLALHGGELPMWLLYQAVRRARAEQGVRPEQAALIKMVLQSQREEGTDMSELDKANRDPAYLCGRLLCLLESVQRAALGETNTTVVDRYYGTASSAPATVFGRLLRGARPHLAKLRQENPGACARLEGALDEVCDGLSAFPTTLSLEKQGLFALGYYHQRAADIAAARAAKAAKVAAEVSVGHADIAK